MFQVIVYTNGTRSACRTVGEFPTYREARRACRRMLRKFWDGLAGGMPEVTRFEPGFMANLDQPTTLNYGRVDCDENGYQTGFTPCELIREAGRNLAAMDRAAELPRIGAHVRLASDLDRSPAYILHAGERGRVTRTGPDVYAVEMDDPPHGLTVLGGEVLWFNEAEFLADIEPASLHDSADDHERRYLR